MAIIIQGCMGMEDMTASCATGTPTGTDIQPEWIPSVHYETLLQFYCQVYPYQAQS